MSGPICPGANQQDLFVAHHDICTWTMALTYLIQDWWNSHFHFRESCYAHNHSCFIWYALMH